jgi:diketogulonate reductase-like aldo/keto reductase
MGTAGVNATDDKAYDKQRGVLYESFSPLCGPCAGTDAKELITGKLVTRIGAKHGKSGAQVALKWQVQQGIPVIPKTSNPAHAAENIDLFDWTLDEDDMAALTAATVPAVAGNPGPGGVPVSGDCDVA